MLLSPIVFSEVEETTRTLEREAVIKEYQTEQSNFINLDGINLHYVDEGAGPVIFLIHGSLGSLNDWDQWAEELKKYYRVVRFDLPGFGLTGEVSSGNYSVERMLTLVDSLADHLQIERFVIAGISYGGLVAFRYAATRVNRTAGLILINSAGIQFGGSRATDNKPLAPKYNIFTDPVVKQENVRDFYQKYVNNQDRITSELLARKTRYLNIKNRAKEATITTKQYERGSPENVLKRVTAPSLILWGEANNALQTKTAKLFQTNLLNAVSTELITYQGAGHMINLDIPEKSVADAKQFLDQLVRPVGWVEQ